MACEFRLRQGQQQAGRVREIREALKRLEEELRAGRVRAVIGANGAIAFAGWADRCDVTDACAYRTLASQGSAALRQAVARAEATSGRKVNAQVVASGAHSHDGGKTWHGGHK